MEIGILDAIRVLKDEDPGLPVIGQIADKYKCSTLEIIGAARHRAVEVMKYAVPNRPAICKEEDGKVHAYCPNCETDISDWDDDWEFCPYCGQAVRMPKEDHG